MSNYSKVEKFLHDIALNFDAIRKVSFEMDCRLAKVDTANIATMTPVFVCGLARCGTTILMRSLHKTGEFASLTYRDMPFVLAPQLWRRISQIGRKSGSFEERVHQDGLKIDYDSPEAFEEVFWLTFLEKSYVKSKSLEKIEIDDQVIRKFRQYVGNVVGRDDNGEKKRYLSKNNNNIIRLEALVKAFPNSIVIIPFRNPYDHAVSMLRQHEIFTEIHNRDSFSKRYMRWLGHYEFGETHRPCRFCPDKYKQKYSDKNEINYWVEYWTEVYKYLIKNTVGNVTFLDYDKLTSFPCEHVEKLSALLSIEKSKIHSATADLRPSTRYDHSSSLDRNNINRALEIHRNLITASL